MAHEVPPSDPGSVGPRVRSFSALRTGPVGASGPARPFGSPEQGSRAHRSRTCAVAATGLGARSGSRARLSRCRNALSAGAAGHSVLRAEPPPPCCRPTTSARVSCALFSQRPAALPRTVSGVNSGGRGGRTSPRRRARQLSSLTTDESSPVGPEEQHPTGQPRLLQGSALRPDLLRRRLGRDAQQ